MDTKKQKPYEIKSDAYRYDAFANGEVLLNKKKGHLPTMGWNSWNAFGSANTEQLTKEIADCLVSLGLKDLGYQYVVLDDGCYKPERAGGLLTNETEKFPSGFRALADYIHDRGLKFGMYNDIGTNLCAGAAVGTCFHEKEDARSYTEWGVDFLKVDNCYFLWDNATFSDEKNARYVYAPAIQRIRISWGDFCRNYAAENGEMKGDGSVLEDGYVKNIGTFDGAGPERTPLGAQSAELQFVIDGIRQAGKYDLDIFYEAGEEIGKGSWLQVATGEKENTRIFYDDFVDADKSLMTVRIELSEGRNVLRLMNHRRQENTLTSYAVLLEAFREAAPEHDIRLSICEWGKTQPQDWAYKVGDSWRILNDITFQVGSEQGPGTARWDDDYTAGIVPQYNKAVIMDEFAGLDRGWNDPDMMVFGMNGITRTMERTHMAMWCMMNAPLMLGLDLRKVKKFDELWQIIANEDLIVLNQDPLGVQAKRIAVFFKEEAKQSEIKNQRPDQIYLRDNERADVLAKPMADGSVALCFLNLSQTDFEGELSVSADEIVHFIGGKMVNADAFADAKGFTVKDLWDKGAYWQTGGVFSVRGLKGCDNVTLRIMPMKGKLTD